MMDWLLILVAIQHLDGEVHEAEKRYNYPSKEACIKARDFLVGAIRAADDNTWEVRVRCEHLSPE